MSDVHPLANTLANSTEIGLDKRSVAVLGLVNKRDGLVVYTVENQENQDRYILKIACPSEDPQEYERWKKALTNEAQVLRSMRSANLAERHHLPLVYELSEVRIVEDRVEHCYPTGLLIQVPQGENVAQLLEARTRLGEHVALRIGVQLAHVLVLAHQEGYQCGKMTPARLFWDNNNQHMMIVDWYAAQDMNNLTLDPVARVAREQDDVRNLALLIYWITMGQPLPADGYTTISRPTSTMSVPLWGLLERLLSNPGMFGDEPASHFLHELNRMLRYWDKPDLFSHAEQYIADIHRQKHSLDMHTLQVLAEQIGIGKVKEPRRPWQRLTDASGDLLVQPLEQIRNEIIEGQFSQALQQVRALSAWPAYHRRVLWRQRIAEIGIADRRLSTEPAFASYRTNMGMAIKAWDGGDYTIPEWLQQLGSLFTQITLVPAAQAVVQRLGYELQVVDLTDRFEATDDIETRLTIIDALEKLFLPGGIDPDIAEQRRKVCSSRATVEEQHNQRVAQQQIEQQEAVFATALARIEQRVNMRDASLAAADFEQLLRQAPTPDTRQKAVDVQTIWEAMRFIKRLPEHGDISDAVRHYVRLRRLHATPDILVEIDPFLSTEVLRRFGLGGTADNLAQVFDRILHLPKPTYDDLIQHRRWLHMLVPAVDSQRRLHYDNMLKKEAQIRKSLETLDLPTSVQEQSEALEELRKQGIVSLQHLYLRFASQRHIQREQHEYQAGLIALFEKTLDKLRAFTPPQTNIPATFGDEVEAIRQAILAGKTSGLKDKHQTLWDQVGYFAPDFEDLFYQHIYFTAYQTAAELKALWSTDTRQGAAEQVLSADRVTQAIDTASRLHRLQIILGETPYGDRVAAFATEQRDLCDRHIEELIRAGVGGETGEQQTHAIVRARQYIAVRDALGGSTNWPVMSPERSAIAALLATQEPAMLQVALRHVPVDITAEQLRRALTHSREPFAAGPYDAMTGYVPVWKTPFFWVGAFVLVGAVILVMTLL